MNVLLHAMLPSLSVCIPEERRGVVVVEGECHAHHLVPAVCTLRRWLRYVCVTFSNFQRVFFSFFPPVPTRAASDAVATATALAAAAAALMSPFRTGSDSSH